MLAGFDLDEEEGAGVSGDDVDFAAFGGLVVGDENFVLMSPEVVACDLLAELADFGRFECGLIFWVNQAGGSVEQRAETIDDGSDRDHIV